jgi:hypothetical protein
MSLLRELAGSLLGKGFRSMAVWVLEKNPSKHFYARCGARYVTSREIEIGGAWFREAAYGRDDLGAIRSAG